MQTVVEGVATLKERIASLMTIMRPFCEPQTNRQLPERTITRMEELVRSASAPVLWRRD